MGFKREFVKAVKLFFLLSLLFWSFTWNLSPELDLSRAEHAHKGLEKTKDCNAEATVHLEGGSDFIRKISASGYNARKSSRSSSSNILIPSFNEWREKEKKKYEKRPSNELIHNHEKLIRRKLNYASSKCGAKILSSNPEARHRNSVLSEKSDEYMLNPCKVRTWFILELCDTVEATQFELANYELYSSSPREFSVFWSEVYPTMLWNLLGTFEAKDQRTMQMFEVNAKNLGKFIKVVIYNHHGKEHFCPLSVIRVLGYSMVEKLEVIAQKENNLDSDLNQSDVPVIINSQSKENRSFSSQSVKSNVSHVSNTTEPSLVKFCSLFLKNCFKIDNTGLRKFYLNKVNCQFLEKVLKITSERCLNVFCYESPNIFRIINDTYSKNSTNKNSTNISSFSNSLEQRKPKVETVSNEKSQTQYDSSKQHWYSSSYKMSNENKGSILQENSTRKENSKIMADNSSFIQNQNLKEASDDIDSSLKTPKTFFRSTENKGQGKCSCETNVKSEQVIMREVETIETKYKPDLTENKESDSAGLNQKESVLFKMTARIRELEVDLNLINKYLQQLSQSYSQQMTDMKTIINHTILEISIASEKAKAIDRKQEESVDALKDGMKILSKKTEYLISGHKDLLRKVIELHGFFLILELIIISTIFSIFLNIFRRNNVSLEVEKQF